MKDLTKRIDDLERKIESLEKLLYTTNQNVLHCADLLDTHLGPIEDQPNINDGWEPACDSEEAPWYV